MPQHSHSHAASNQHSNVKGDMYTIAATLIGGATDALASYYYFAELVGLLDGSEDNDSIYARAAGALASTAALISMYTHYKLYAFHQTRTQETNKQNAITNLSMAHDEESSVANKNQPQPSHIDPSTSINSSRAHFQAASQVVQAALQKPLLTSDSEAHQHSPECKHSDTHEPHGPSLFQRIALKLDGLTHTAGIAGTFAATTNATFGPFSFWGKVAIHSASLAAGVLGSVAEVRNEEDALKQQAASKQ